MSALILRICMILLRDSQFFVAKVVVLIGCYVSDFGGVVIVTITFIY